MRPDEHPAEEPVKLPDLTQTYDTPDTEVLPPEALREFSVPLAVEVVGGPMDGHRARVDGDALTLGRHLENDCALVLDPMVSGRHARIAREEGHYWLEDLESRNGTFFGDHRIDERVLITPGATLYVGQTRLEFMPR